MTSIKTCSARNDHVTIRAITILPSPFHTWEPVFYLQLHSECLSIVQSENIFAKGLRYGGQSNEKKEAKERKKITFEERPTGLSVSPSPSRPWNQLTSRGRSSYRIVRNAGEEGVIAQCFEIPWHRNAHCRTPCHILRVPLCLGEFVTRKRMSEGVDRKKEKKQQEKRKRTSRRAVASSTPLPLVYLLFIFLSFSLAL